MNKNIQERIESVKKLVEDPQTFNEFEQEIEEDIFDKLEFASKESELPMAQVEFGEEQVRFKYRDKNGDLSTLGRITLSTSSAHFITK